jgi:hypothetical protein
MAVEIEITISKADLGPEQPEVDIVKDDLELFDADRKTVRVKVFVDGELADVAKVTDTSISAKVPPRPDEGMLSVVATTQHDKIIQVLEYDPKEKKIRKPVDDPQDDEAALIKAIGDAAQKIATAMAQTTEPRRTR